MNRKSGLYPAVIVLIVMLSISIPTLWQRAAAQEKSTRDFPKPKSLTLGLLPEKNLFEQRKRHKAIARYIAKHLEISVHLYTLPQYASVFEAFNEGEIDAAFLGSFSYVLTRNLLPIELLTRPVWPDGSSTDRSYIFARKDSGIKTVTDMVGKSLVLVDKGTTTGYLYPLSYMKEHGIHNMESFFSNVWFAGSHDGSAWAVYKAEADVGACKANVFQALAEEFPQFKEQVIVLAESFELPSNGFVVSQNLNRAFKDQLRDLLLSLDKSAEGRSALKDLGVLKFIPAGDEDYAPVYQMIDELQLDLNIFLDRDYRS